MNGDILTRAKFDGLLKFHSEYNATATMTVREFDYKVPYGVVNIEDYHIRSIEEKPLQHFLVNAGVYVLSPEALENLTKNTFLDMPTLFNHLLSIGKTTIAYPIREYWLDIGHLNEYERAHADFESNFQE